MFNFPDLHTLTPLKMKRILLLTITVIWSVGVLTMSAQSESSNHFLESEDTLNLGKTIPGLNAFIESAIQNSPLLKASDKEVAAIFEQIKKEKKSWTEFIILDGNARYGLFNTVTLSDLSSSTGTDVTVKSAKQQLNYYAGVTLRLPLSAFMTKKNEVAALNLTIEANKLKKEQAKIELTQLVIDEYYKLLRLIKSVQINQNVVQSVRIDYMKAKKDVSTGLIGINEFNAIIITKEKIEETYNVSLNDYLAQYYKIQILTGLNINSKK